MQMWDAYGRPAVLTASTPRADLGEAVLLSEMSDAQFLKVCGISLECVDAQ